MANSPTFNAAKQKAFLEALRQTANVSRSARMVGVSSGTVYKYRDAYPAFAEGWKDALEEAADELEESARKRALGVREAVYYQGEVVGYQTVYSDAMTALLLKAHRPEKYRERTETRYTGGLSVNVTTGVPQPGEDLA